MGLKPKFNKTGLETQINAKLERLTKALIIILSAIGENFVKNAREKANFKDRTGNLRSSIGFAIFLDGKAIKTGFAGGTGGAAAQVETAIAAVKYPKGLALICVAGMQYAAAVESRNFDVITSSALLAEEELKADIKDLQNKIEKM